MLNVPEDVAIVAQTKVYILNVTLETVANDIEKEAG